MSTYRYQPGDRPLDGFTVRAPAGRGGFGEVYFAESDAGREVALKALYVTQGYDEIELRGIRHCMNLKSPHLVSIFDVKTGDDGTPFVIMEYVAGPSLRDLLNDSPQGMGTDKAAFFLREVAKGLSHLHGYGVVHRDLKPANIFYEDGYVKIGDYGLSKLMSADAAASQTVTVGSVHYMAPEIGAGKYDKSIDLYALGCLLYEMLTGRVPYAGTSPSEVLMKHLQAEPDLRDVPEHFARVIKKALQKDPEQRYATAAEMVEDLFGTEHVRNSVSQLNAAELSTYAARAGRKVNTPTPPPPPPTHAPASSPPAEAPGLDAASADSHHPHAIHQWPREPAKIAALLAVVIAGLTALATSDAPNAPLQLRSVFVLAVGLAGAASTARVRFHPNAVATARALFIQRLLPAAAVWGTALGVTAFYAPPAADDYFLGGFAWAAVMLFVNWQAYTRADRTRGFSLALWLGLPALAALIGVWFSPEMPLVLAGVALITTLGAQLMSPPTLRTPPPRTRPNPADRPPAALNAGEAHSLPPQPHAQAMPRASVSAPSEDFADTSRHSRLAALVLCAAGFVTPLGGLHRFYTGRWLTGILWLCTWGLFGIGQLIDVILIAAGAFTDARGQRVTRWDLAPAADRPPSSSRHTWTPTLDGRPSTLAIGLHLTGIALLLLGVAFMLPLWFSLPELVDTLPVFAELRAGIGQDLGYDAWPELIERLLFALALTTLIAGTLLTAFVRRGAIVHLLRALAGGTLLSFLALFVATGRVIHVSRVERALQRLSPADPYSPLANIHAFLDAAMRPELVIALFWLALAAALFAIPARRHPVEGQHGENRPPITGNQP